MYVEDFSKSIVINILRFCSKNYNDQNATSIASLVFPVNNPAMFFPWIMSSFSPFKFFL